MGRILVVDDEKFICESLRRVLSNEGHEVRDSYSGEEALSLLKDYSPDVIILDFKMPGLDGLEVCRRIRSNQKTKDIPIIMVTVHPQEKEMALKAGANDFLSKPIDNIDILVRVKYMLKISQLTDELSQFTKYLDDLKKIKKDW